MLQLEAKPKSLSFKSAFFGSFEHSIDSKGRVILPLPFRESLGESFVISVTKNFDAVAFYTEREFQEIFEKAQQYDDRKRSVAMYNRFFFTSSYINQSCDNQGRCLIPIKLREKILNKEKDVVFASEGGHIVLMPAVDYNKDFDNFLSNRQQFCDEYLDSIQESEK